MGIVNESGAATRRGDRQAQFQRRLARLQAPPKQPARTYAVWLLSRREYSAAQLRDRLTRRGYGQEEVQATLELLQRHQYQSDGRFAASRVRADAGRYGDRGIRFRLQMKGIGADLANEELAAAAPEAERAVAAVARFEGHPLDDKLRAKVWRFLGSRGFSRESIDAAVRHLGSSIQESE